MDVACPKCQSVVSVVVAGEGADERPPGNAVPIVRCLALSATPRNRSSGRQGRRGGHGAGLPPGFRRVPKAERTDRPVRGLTVPESDKAWVVMCRDTGNSTATSLTLSMRSACSGQRTRRYERPSASGGTTRANIASTTARPPRSNAGSGSHPRTLAQTMDQVVR